MYDLGLTHTPMFTYPAETGRSFCPYTQLKTDLSIIGRLSGRARLPVEIVGSVWLVHFN